MYRLRTPQSTRVQMSSTLRFVHIYSSHAALEQEQDNGSYVAKEGALGSGGLFSRLVSVCLLRRRLYGKVPLDRRARFF
jgi:hypothetical protein